MPTLFVEIYAARASSLLFRTVTTASRKYRLTKDATMKGFGSKMLSAGPKIFGRRPRDTANAPEIAYLL
jgi:hypothetical protein